MHILMLEPVRWGNDMRHVCGFACFCCGIGMTVVLILPKTFLLVLITIGILILGYNLFCC